MTNILSMQITTTRRPDCVTEARMGNTVRTVSGCFRWDTTQTPGTALHHRKANHSSDFLSRFCEKHRKA